MKAVIIGPGRVGCGFAGHLLRASGYDLTFIGRNQRLLSHLNTAGRYRVRLSNGADSVETEVGGVDAVSIHDQARAVDEIANANVVATAVGPDNLADVAPLISAGLARRQSPVNVLAFENLEDPGRRLRQLVARELGARRAGAHGFVSALVSRAVSHLEMARDCAEPVTLIGDQAETFVVDGRALRDPKPVIAGMKVAADYGAHVHRKLYMFSAGHATCAYIGYLKGYRYIHAAVRDPEIRAVVRKAMAEGQAGLAARYGAAIAGGRDTLTAVLRRFDNAVLNDPVTRVARDPFRKLAPADRLVGALRLAAKAGRRPTNLAVGIAAALHYRNPDDPAAVLLDRDMGSQGVRAAMERICAIDSASRLGHLVMSRYDRFARGWQRENLLIDLKTMTWAWQRPSRHNEMSECGRLTGRALYSLITRAPRPE